MALIEHNSALGRELLAFEEERCNALISNDAETLERLLHADLVHVHSSGMVHSKAEFIAHVGKMGGFVSIVRGNLELRTMNGNAGAIITGPTTNRVRRLATGEIVDLVGFGTVVAARGPDSWQVLLSQITPKG